MVCARPRRRSPRRPSPTPTPATRPNAIGPCRTAPSRVRAAGWAGRERGVKCLHAHYAWHLAGGDDPVGRWVAERLAAVLDIDVRADRDHVPPRRTRSRRSPSVRPPCSTVSWLIPIHPPRSSSPTRSASCPTISTTSSAKTRASPPPATSGVLGAEPWHLAQVERGGGVTEATVPLDREAAEDVFRVLATERRGRSAAQPGPRAGPCRHDPRHVLCRPRRHAPAAPRPGRGRRQRGRISGR